MTGAPQAELLFVRHGGFADFFRSYTVSVDGAVVGTLKRKSTLGISLPPGMHRIEARIDWTMAEALTLDLTAGAVRRVEIANTYGAMHAGYAITAGAGSYLTIIDHGAD